MGGNSLNKKLARQKEKKNIAKELNSKWGIRGKKNGHMREIHSLMGSEQTFNGLSY